MGKIEWAMWANEQAIASAWVTILGGILAVVGQFEHWRIGVYAIVLGCVTFIFEYPRGKRHKGTSHQRWMQWPLAVVVSHGRILTRNYFVRFVFNLVVSIPCCFILSTLLGAVCYMITGVIYLIAASKGEEWHMIPRKEETRGPKVIEEPSRPPPRRPDPPRTPAAPSENQV